MTYLNSLFGIFCLAILSTTANAQLVWSAPMLVADSGDVIGVDLTVSGYQNMISSQGTIRFDETILEYSHVDNFALVSISSGSFGETQVGQGLLNFSWYEGDLVGKAIPDNDAAFTMYFTVIGYSEQVSHIELIDTPVVAEFVEEGFVTVPHTFEIGSVTVSGVSSVDEISQENQLDIFPNPARDWIKIENNAIGEKLEIGWFDTNGALIKKAIFFNSGEQIIINTQDLNRGMYIVRVGNDVLGFKNQIIKVE